MGNTAPRSRPSRRLIDAFDLPRLVDEANGAAASAEAGAEGTITQPFHVRDAVKLCFPLGFLGLHHFWLRRPAWGFAFLFSVSSGRVAERPVPLTA